MMFSAEHRPDNSKEAAGELGPEDKEKSWEERPKKPAKRKQRGPAKNVGDNSPNPLPDDTSDNDNKAGGDAGRT